MGEESENFDLVNYIEDQQIDIEALESFYIEEFDLSLFDSHEIQKAESCMAIPNVSQNISPCYEIIDNGDGTFTLLPQRQQAIIYEITFPIMSPTTSMDFSDSSESSNSNIERRGRGRPSNNLEEMQEEAKRISKNNPLYKKTQNNLASVRYRRNKKQRKQEIQKKIDNDLKCNLKRNEKLQNKWSRVCKNIEKCKQLLTKFGIPETFYADIY